MKAEPQNVLDYRGDNTIFIVWNFKKDQDIAAVFQRVCALVINLNNSVDTRFPDSGAACIMGIGYDAWLRLGLPDPPPKELANFAPIVGAKHVAVATRGDLHFHLKGTSSSICYDMAATLAQLLEPVAVSVEEVHGFRYWDGRSILGFVDGTENPKGEKRAFFGLIGEEDPVYNGGSYLFVQKYIHNLTAFKALPVEEQEKVFGRSKEHDIEMSDDQKPSNSHIALANIGDDLKVIRDNLPFGNMSTNEMGTYFIAYASTFSTVKKMLDNMFIGSPEGNYDRLLDFSTAKTGTLFFVPSASILKNVASGTPVLEVASATPNNGEANQRASRSSSFDGSLSIGSLKKKQDMNNLYRELAPVSEAAWAEIETEARRTLKRHLAARRVVDVEGPKGVDFSAVGTGHTKGIPAPGEGIQAVRREVQALVELRVPFELTRQAVDDVERGATDSDWQAVKDAARKIAFAEDNSVFEGYEAAGIEGIRKGNSNPVLTLPSSVRGYLDVIAQAVSQLRLAGVNGPYALVLGSDPYTAVSGGSDEGYPVLEHIRRMIDGEIIWAPAIRGGFVLSTRGGDFELDLGQDISIGYLSHTDTSVKLYLQESFTFRLLTTEAAVALSPAEK